jgi:hypothetical protein
MLDETMNYSTLEEVYGKPFGQRVPVTHQRKDVEPIAKPEFTSLSQKAEDSVKKNQSIVDSLKDSLPLDTNPATESFSAPAAPPRVTFREKFSTSQPASVFEGSEQSEKLSRILRLIEQNRTGYERPAIQDMVLYIATGVFFLFTFDTFVMMGKSMRGK